MKQADKPKYKPIHTEEERQEYARKLFNTDNVNYPHIPTLLACCPYCSRILVIKQWLDERGEVRTIVKREEVRQK